MELPRRKDIRLKNYDYSQSGAYFITICTQNRENLFGRIHVGDGFPVPTMMLSKKGEIIEQYTLDLPTKFANIKIDKHTIMPNHIHMIIVINDIESGEETLHGTGNPSPTATIGSMMGWYKYQTTKAINERDCIGIIRIWQRSYYDHIIRNEQEYQEIWQYIDTNIQKWEDDCHYII